MTPALSTGEPIQLIDDAEIAAAYISPASQRDLIQQHLIGRRDRGEISANLPERPNILFVGRGLAKEKLEWAAQWQKIADVHTYGWNWDIDSYANDWPTKVKPQFNEKVRQDVAGIIKKFDIHIVFCYVSGRWVYPETIQSIRDLGVITVNWTYDDTLKFWGYIGPTGFMGDAGLARVFDVYVTAQSKRNIGKYILVGGRPLFLPPGGIPIVNDFCADRETPVSFIGSRYGKRTEIIDLLRANGIPVVTRGKGWIEGIAEQSEVDKIIGHSLLTLGFGYIANTGRIGLKGRDFRIPFYGVAYMTTWFDELTEFFEPDREILMWSTIGDLLNKIRYYISHPEEAVRIGLAGQARVLKEHTWEHRFKEILEVIK